MTDINLHTGDTTADPAAIERDIRQTQDEMSRTVDKLGNQLTMKNLFNSLLDKADESGVDAHYLLEGARRNPMALGLIAAGAIWLVSDKDSKFPSMSSSGKSGSGGLDEFGLEGRDVHHRDYVSHMSSLEMRESEDPMDYQRRRDLHRANFMMCEPKPNEDDHSFRHRLDEMTDKFREKRGAWSDAVSQAGSSAGQSAQQLTQSDQRTARQALNRGQDLYDSNPLVGGILAAAVGAALGWGIPISRKEQETMGDIGAEAREMISEQKDQLTDQLREKKDQLVDRVDEKLQATSGQQQNQQAQPSGQGQRSPDRQSEPTRSDRPFIISDPRR